MKPSICKYTAIFILSLKDAINYRNELMVWAILEATPVFTMLILWSTIFADRAQIAGFNQQLIISYYLIGHIFSQLVASHFEEYAISQIQQGQYKKYFLKPFSVKLYHSIGQLGWRVITLFTSILPVVLLAFLTVGNFFPSLSSTTILLLPLFYLISYFFEATISLTIIAIGFVFEQAKGFRHLKWMLGWVFSGSMMPLDLMPNWLARASRFLPFQFSFHVPVQLVLGRIDSDLILPLLIQGLVWLGAFVLFMNLLWHLTLKKYSAVGG